MGTFTQWAENPIPCVFYYTVIHIADAYSEPCKKSKTDCFEKTVNGYYPLTNFVKLSFLDVWQNSDYASGASSWFLFSKETWESF